MRFVRFFSFALFITLLAPLCRADSVQLTFAGCDNPNWAALSAHPGGPALTLETYAWSQDAKVGSSTNVGFITLKYNSPVNIQNYLAWANSQGYAVNDNTLIVESSWSSFLAPITVNGELPDPYTSPLATIYFLSQPALTIGSSWAGAGGAGLSSVLGGSFSVAYHAFYPDQNIWVTGSLSGAPQAGFVFGDSPNGQSQDFSMSFQVDRIPEPGTAWLFAGIAPILLYRRFRRRAE